ncbi:MAG: VWA domain-containing protein [Alphaproteobacteria bacterium]|nr:VWA domain-containing protein [Alphaproteobacteria bacterium]
MVRLVPIFSLVLSLAGCYAMGEPVELYGGDYGVTGGGAQDIGYARDVIAQGGVPTDADFPVEGLLSEHHLPTSGEPCEDLICARPAAGAALDLSTGEDAVWVQLGMTSGLSAPFQRPPADLAVVIDKSQSMSVDMAETIEAVKRLVAQLRDEDHIEIVAVDGSVHVVHPFGPVGDRSALFAALDGVHASGGFQIQEGIDHAFATLQAHRNPMRVQRVMTITCGYPGVTDAFTESLEAGADAGIGLSMYGVLLGYDAATADLLGQTRGGSFTYLLDLDTVKAAFDTELDLRITPLAYDLAYDLQALDGWEVESIYGVPGEPDAIDVNVVTAFPSTRAGAVFAKLRRVEGDSDASVKVAIGYEPNPALGFDAPADAERTRTAGVGEEPWVGVQIGAALVNEAVQMSAACARYHAGDAEGGIALLEPLHAHLSEVAAELEHPGLAAEADLVAQLLTNMGA